MICRLLVANSISSQLVCFHRLRLQTWHFRFEVPPSQATCLQVEPGKPGAEVSKKKTISQRKYLPIECAQGDQPLRCPNRVV